MAHRTKSLHIANTSKQLRALASPPRLDLLYRFMALNEATVKQVAELIRTQPASLYRHVSILVDAGLLISSGSTECGRNEAELFRPIATRIQLPHISEHPRLADEIAAVLRAQLRACERDVINAHANRNSVRSGPKRDLLLFNTTVWLTNKELTQVNASVDKILDIITIAGDVRQNTKPIGITYAMRSNTID